ncbi:AAA family ATPase [Lentzea sp. JNUCC 0626]|uniref:AAA family ATPase n=1 Tax=Lentzea sp. JNUCC 0626 TaxID=3367513 RepID=UPI003747FB92
MTTASPAAAPVRLTGGRGPRPGEPLWILHGPGVDDRFAGADLHLRSAEEMLWELLHAAGYERIVFSGYRDAVYFRDEDSRNLTRAPGTADPEPRRRNAMRRFSGPLGDMMLLSEPPPQPRRPSAATDTERLRMLDGIMVDAAISSAVVVPNAETWLENIQPDLRRPFAEMLGRWSAGAGGDNVCVLLFSQPDLAEIVDFVRGQRYLPQLTDKLAALATRRSGQAVGHLGFPEETELAALVHGTRLRHGLRIADWTALPHLLRVMAAQEIPVRVWERLLRRLAGRAELSVEVLREQGMAEVAVADARDVWRRLDEMVGMTAVKTFLTRHRHVLEAGQALRARGLDADAEPAALHLTFTGNPGTGKTVVARMVGELYRDLGLLRRGHVVEAKVEDLVSPHGDTARLTSARVQAALDGVLFVDEAYRLSEDPLGLGTQAIDVLLTEMENHRDRLVVIVAGYADRIDDFLAANQGLSGRFPRGNRLVFPDYTPAELHEILLGQLRRQGLDCADDLVTALRTVTEAMYRTRSADFANARTMRELAAEIRTEWASRTRLTRDGEITPATAQDVPAHYRGYLAEQKPIDEVLAELDRLTGLQAVKDTVRELAAVLELRRLQESDASQVAAPHLLFLGSPGTGKTTVAKLLGKAFAALGLLYRGHVVVTTRADLVGEYVGQTAPKTRAKVLEALDGVLLIDEAYELAGEGNDFGSEAVAELITLMETYRGRLVVIAAGYPERMDEFVRGNAGVLSRAERLHFADYTLPELRSIFVGMVEEMGWTCDPAVPARAVRWLEHNRQEMARQGRDFGNARTVRNLVATMERRLAVRVLKLPQAERRAQARHLVGQDVPEPETS